MTVKVTLAQPLADAIGKLDHPKRLQLEDAADLLVRLLRLTRTRMAARLEVPADDTSLLTADDEELEGGLDPRVVAYGPGLVDLTV